MVLFCGQAILPSSFSDSSDQNISLKDDILSADIKKVCYSLLFTLLHAVL